MERKSQVPEGVFALCGLAGMLVLFLGVGMESSATAPVAGVAAGFFALSFLIYFFRHWAAPEKGSLLADVKHYRYVLVLIAVISITVAAINAEKVFLFFAGSVGLFLVGSIAFLYMAMWFNHFRDMYQLVRKDVGPFLQNPRAWISLKVVFALGPLALIVGVAVASLVL